MRFFYFLYLSLLVLVGCTDGYRRIEGNGVLEKQEKILNDFETIEISSDFDVKIISSPDYRVSYTADENLMQYIIIDQKGDRLRISSKNSVNLKPSRKIEVKVYGNSFGKVELTGSGSVRSEGVLENDNKIEVIIAGSGDTNLQIKTPDTRVRIGGSGKVILEGKTRNAKINIAGSGDYLAENLLSENVDVSIAGSGNAEVFASVDLKINIAGTGDVAYRGNPTNIKKNIAGSGSIIAVE